MVSGESSSDLSKDEHPSVSAGSISSSQRDSILIAVQRALLQRQAQIQVCNKPPVPHPYMVQVSSLLVVQKVHTSLCLHNSVLCYQEAYVISAHLTK